MDCLVESLSTEGRTMRIMFFCMNLSSFDIDQDISVFITSSYQVIEVYLVTTALIEHVYAQYQHPNATFYDDRVSVAVPNIELFNLLPFSLLGTAE